jgi:hypothetical protein
MPKQHGSDFNRSHTVLEITELPLLSSAKPFKSNLNDLISEHLSESPAMTVWVELNTSPPQDHKQ